MLKKLLFLMIPLSAQAISYKWTDFDNNVYIGGAYSSNRVVTDRFETPSTDSGVANIGLSLLMNSGVYVNVDGNANFLSGGSFVGDWYHGGLRVGYSFPMGVFNLIPYLDTGMGNEGAYYSSSSNINYGAGLLAELIVNNDWQLFADINYQLQDFSANATNDFNRNLLRTNDTDYSMNGNPYSYGISIGAKYITSGGYFISPYVKYQDYEQSFSANGGIVNYGTLNPQVGLYQVGINFGIVL